MSALIEISEAQRKASIALFEEWGLDPNEANADDWNRSGYRGFSRDGGEGKWHEWPTGFPVDELIRIRGGVGR